MADAAAHSVLVFAQTTSVVNGTDKGTAWKGAKNFKYLGHSLKK
jgi:hypothetical protein